MSNIGKDENRAGRELLTGLDWVASFNTRATEKVEVGMKQIETFRVNDSEQDYVKAADVEDLIMERGLEDYVQRKRIQLWRNRALKRMTRTQLARLVRRMDPL
jgi:hypothetical protein